MRQYDYFVNPSGGPNFVTGQNQLVPNISAMVTYTDVENSRLAVVPESGRTIILGENVYMNSGDNNWKFLGADYENIKLGTSHIILAPTLKGSWVTHTDAYQPSDVLVQGRYGNNAFSTVMLPGDSFNQLGIRGYPLQAYYTKAAAVASADLRFPLWRVNAGPGTDPVFLTNLWGFGFVEDTYFPARDQVATTLHRREPECTWASSSRNTFRSIYPSSTTTASIREPVGRARCMGWRGSIWFFPKPKLVFQRIQRLEIPLSPSSVSFSFRPVAFASS